MYSYGSLIGMIYDFLEKGSGTDYIFSIVPKGEKGCIRFLEKLKNEMDIPEDIYEQTSAYCTETMLANEIKGFMSGIYFALKLKDEFKEDIDKIKTCFNLTDN
ncbi:MAG: hypothetical protein Q4F75_09500 [Pseudomonadota bacterium]|nr:hypothetical protein [Pseudomonadota bacterium]